ncbi:hypothetical protein ACWD0Z_10245 [Streptomyces sp. NPDC003007]
MARKSHSYRSNCKCTGCSIIRRQVAAKNTTKGVAGAIVSAAITVAGATASPGQASNTFATNTAKSSVQARGEATGNAARGATTSKGRGSSGSSGRR